MSDLLQQLKGERRAAGVNALSYVEQISGPVFVITTPAVDIAELLASVAAPRPPQAAAG